MFVDWGLQEVKFFTVDYHIQVKHLSLEQSKLKIKQDCQLMLTGFGQFVSPKRRLAHAQPIVTVQVATITPPVISAFQRKFATVLETASVTPNSATATPSSANSTGGRVAVYI